MSMDRAISSAAPVLRPQALTAAGFASYGDVLAPEGERVTPVNDGRALRYDGLADLSHVTGADVPVLSLYRVNASTLPFRADLFERHPLSSQVFLPMSSDEFLIVVAPDRGGEPESAPPRRSSRPSAPASTTGRNLARAARHPRPGGDFCHADVGSRHRRHRRISAGRPLTIPA